MISPPSLSKSYFAPQPKAATISQNIVSLPSALSCSGGTKEIRSYLAKNLFPEGIQIQDKVEERAFIVLNVDSQSIEHEQGYILTISQDGITITGHDEHGLFYGVTTLLQIIEAADRVENTLLVPILEIEDWPDFIHRGVHFDISRDKVPTLKTLETLIDNLAKWKINQLQFNIEHTFAYQGHKTVWENASPLTKEEILYLDQYCKKRYIEFIPHQNSLAHLHRWIQHPEYRHLSESPTEIDTKFLTKENYQHEGNAGYSICPTDPKSKELIEDLYSQLLPLFSSKHCNVGLDEPTDITRGGERSKSDIAARGSQNVLNDWLLFLRETLQTHGKEKMQMWADSILFEENLLDHLPKDVVPLLWGYENGFPFELGKRFSDRNLSWYVAPSTCTWNSIGGRTSDAIHNLSQAADKGHLHGASGYLITEWGDNGHHHPLGISYLGLLAGACFSWNVRSTKEAEKLDISYLLDRHVFRDKTGQMGRLAYQVGDLFKKAIHEKSRLSCCSALFRLLVFNGDFPDEEVVKSLSPDGLQRVEEYLSSAREILKSSQMTGSEASILHSEFSLVIELLDCARHFGQLLLEHPNITKLKELPEQDRNTLETRLKAAIIEYETVWRLRNREGGLSESVRRLNHLTRLLTPPFFRSLFKRLSESLCIRPSKKSEQNAPPIKVFV
jgi:hypothetical protein